MSDSSILWTECKQCVQAVAAAAHLCDRLACYPRDLWITGQQEDTDARPYGEHERIFRLLKVHCSKCQDTRKVLTEDGKLLMKLIRVDLEQEE